MLCKQHYEKMIAKLSRFEETLNPYLFTKFNLFLPRPLWQISSITTFHLMCNLKK